MPEFISSNVGAFTGLGVLFALFILLLTVWTVVWKGFALWIAAHEEQKPWFIVLLILNTAGILEIIYIFFVSKKGKESFKNWKQRHFKTKGNKASEEVVTNVSEEN